MRVITLNVNGIRSAARKGLFAWLAAQNADAVALQETRSQEHQLPLEASALARYHSYYVDAQRPGYSGVALYTRREPIAVTRGLGWPDMDAEGRYIEADFGDLRIASVYVPSGTSGPARQAVKMNFLERFLIFLAGLRKTGREYVICGDYNIAHNAIDTFDPVRNSSVTGFFPEERAWMDALVDGAGWVDAFRVVNDEPKQYTWWPNWPKAYPNNLGWRIDYQMITPGLRSAVSAASIYKQNRFSDHAPLTVDYDL
ncbi:MAG TPA: exodeoxyribonuclease III [Candidatus Baltobacteraceae bacterium]|nr:exodeoxyribonuclease III [Candidatus Baltobacteraceae bacterium]